MNNNIENVLSNVMYYQYHTFSEWKLFKNQNERPKKYIGYELEVDRSDYSNDYQFWNWVDRNGNMVERTPQTIKDNANKFYNIINNNLNAILMRDGSLSSAGVEIISHPQSYKYIIANKDKYKECFKQLQEMGYTSHDNGRCGLHFHFTRPENEEAVERMVLIVENFKEEIINFSRRSRGQLTDWSKFMTDYTYTKSDLAKSMYYIKKNKDKVGVKGDTGHNKRYHAVNTINPKTIEFRFNRGTLNIDTFIASLQLCNRIYDTACDLSIEINTIDWLDLIKDEECFTYCKERGIIASHFATDNTDKVLKAIEEVKINVNKLKEIINDYNNWSVMTFKKEVKIRDIKTMDDINKLVNKSNDYRTAYNYVKYLTSAIDNFNPETLDYEALLSYIKDLMYYLPTDYYKHRFNIIYKAIKEAI